MNDHSIHSVHAERKMTNLSGKHSFTPNPSLSPYRQTDRMMDGETNTHAAHGLEELFYICVVLSVFWLWQEIVFGVTLSTSCAIVSVCWLWREIVFGCTASKKNIYFLQ